MKPLEKDLIYITDVFKDVFYNGTYLDIQGSQITLRKGFDKSDGCTCADDDETNLPYCRLHDALLLENIKGVTRHMKDKVFYEGLKRNKYKWKGWLPFGAEIYYTGVSLNTFRKWLFK